MADEAQLPTAEDFLTLAYDERWDAVRRAARRWWEIFSQSKDDFPSFEGDGELNGCVARMARHFGTMAAIETPLASPTHLSDLRQLLQEISHHVAVLTGGTDAREQSRNWLAGTAEKRLVELASLLATSSKLATEQALAALLNGKKDVETYIRDVAPGEIEQSVNRAFAGTLKQVEALRDATLAARDGAQKAAQDAGVAAQHDLFARQASAHRRSARGWLLATGLLALGVTGLGVYLLVEVMGARGDGPGFGLTGAAMRVVLLSFLTYVVSWAGRNYRAERHHTIVNEHRQIALQSLDALTAGAGDSHERRAVVMTAVIATLYGASPTGFDDPKDSAPTIDKSARKMLKTSGS